ncbi:MAG: hypothetical protein EAZ06_07655 [Cytophagales bacterium]|nr:MAG: hypothetical protein EAY69_02485 [Cytophagales bacterium]TAH29156.1 MAG: hypothetical protein EAZ06_07655 [Cytophagales bacterium]
MKGFFITEESAKSLGLLQNDDFLKNSYKTAIVVTQLDFQNVIDEAIEQNDTQYKNIKLKEKDFEEYANWFYENYYDGIMESFFQDKV